MQTNQTENDTVHTIDFEWQQNRKRTKLILTFKRCRLRKVKHFSLWRISIKVQHRKNLHVFYLTNFSQRERNNQQNATATAIKIK